MALRGAEPKINGRVGVGTNCGAGKHFKSTDVSEILVDVNIIIAVLDVVIVFLIFRGVGERARWYFSGEIDFVVHA